MSRKKSHPCNEYIIKDGKFIRDFEAMYQNVLDPWNQKARHQESLLNNSTFWFLQDVIRMGKPPRSILDIGCSEGYYAKNLLKISEYPQAMYVGTDVSSTVIQKAKLSTSVKEKHRVSFYVDDIRILNKEFIGRFDLVFSSKTLYYVAPEIDLVLNHIDSYLVENGFFCFNINTTPDAFSNKWMTYEILRKKILEKEYIEKIFVEINRFGQETLVIGIYQKINLKKW